MKQTDGQHEISYSIEKNLKRHLNFINSGVITSPNYPENYPDNLNMKQYVIKVAQGKKVELTIEDLAIEACEDCSCDRLEIYDTPATGYPTILDVSKAFLYNYNQHCKSRRPEL